MRSAQKLPSVFAPSGPGWRVSPRASASATPMPTAAEVKLCQASPAIWVRYDMVVSPA